MNPHRVVIVGAGFAGLSAAKALAKAPVEITLIDRQNHHVFQPLLYQVATAALSPSDIAAPIRAILRRARNTRVVLAEVDGVDTAAREVISAGRRFAYDTLILATGARHAYFGHPEWATAAPGLKTAEDAIHIRRRILVALERAETESDPAERRRLLTFVVVGGGPTGVEMAGAIAELGRLSLAADFRAIDPRSTRIVLVEAGPRLLPAFSPRSSGAAARALASLGVEVLTASAVTAVDCGGVALGRDRIEARTVVWAAGVMASPVGAWLGVPTDRAGRVVVAPDLSVPGHPEILVLGDTALATADGRPVPGVALAAKQQGAHAARVIRAHLAGREPPAFRYRSAGQLATVGRRRAVAEFGRLRVSGLPAWLLWNAAHVWFLIGFRNRAVVAASWAWTYLTAQRGTRLITGPVGSVFPEPVPAIANERRILR